MRMTEKIAIVGLIALLLLPATAAQAADTYVDWVGTTSDFWLGSNWNPADPDLSVTNARMDGTGTDPIVTASGTVYALTFQTNDGLTLGTADSSYVLTLGKNTAGGAAIESSVSAEIAVGLNPAAPNATRITATGSGTVLTLAGALTRTQGKWNLNAGSGATIVLSGNNALSGDVYVSSTGVIEAATVGALNNWSGGIYFGAYVYSKRAGGTTLKLSQSYNLDQVDATLQGNTGYDNYDVEYTIETVGGTTSTMKNFEITGNRNAVTLHKTGSGTLIFTGTNGTVGTTTEPNAIQVEAGTLLVNNTSGSPIHSSVLVNVQDGGTFGGTGSITSSVVVNSNGHLAPGASVGYVGVGSLTLDTGSILDFEFNSTPDNDLVAVSNAGGLTINGGHLYLYEEGTTNAWSTPGAYALFQYTAGYSGDLANLTVANAQQGYSYDFSTYDFESDSYVMLTISGAPVPEPATLGLLALGGLGMIGTAARRRRRSA